MDIKQLSAMLAVKPMTLYGWVHDGYIPYFKLGACVRFKIKDIDEWLEKRKVSSRKLKISEVELD